MATNLFFSSQNPGESNYGPGFFRAAQCWPMCSKPRKKSVTLAYKFLILRKRKKKGISDDTMLSSKPQVWLFWSGWAFVVRCGPSNAEIKPC